MQNSNGYVRGLIRKSGERYYKHSLREQAAKLLAELDGNAPEAVPPLLEFIPQTTPEYTSPVHLKPVTDAFERIAHGDQVELAFSVPPRHTKTDTLLHGLIWLMKQRPGLRVAYLTHSLDFAENRSRHAMRVAERAGFGRGSRWTFGEWETDTGCVFRAGSLLGSIVGLGFDVIVVDDPYRKRAEAESANIRNRTLESFQADVYTRQGVTPTSFIVLHTRWHTDDLIGSITKPDFAGGRPFNYINLPAINDDGEALWPEVWPVERFAPMRANAYEWASQYQGRPVPRGSAVFEQPTTCLLSEVPYEGRTAIGVDLAYTAKTHADYSISLAMLQRGDKYYVVDVQRKQVQAPDFALTLKAHSSRYPGSPMVWHCSGTEQGSAQFIKHLGIPLTAKTATSDKFVRAQDVSAAWNDGRVIVPRDASWSNTFLDEVCAFTGVGDLHDDQVDALASAFGALKQSGASVRYTSVKKRQTSGWSSHY